MTSSTMPCSVGCLCTFRMRFWDTQSGAFKVKSRPALVIGDERNNDYTVLPLSTISKPYYIDPDYDVRIEPARFPNLRIGKVSYIRTHKQCTQNKANLNKVIADVKTEYPDLYLDVLSLVEQWNNEMKNKWF